MELFEWGPGAGALGVVVGWGMPKPTVNYSIHAISIRYFSVSLLRYIQSKSIEESVNLFGHDSERSAAQRAVLSAGQKSFQILMLLE